jgi:hypothetical protein
MPKEDSLTFLVLGQAEVAIPARHEHHVISKVFSLDLGLLKHDNIGFENVKHALSLK